MDNPDDQFGVEQSAIIDHNRRAYDQMARAGEPLCQPATKQELEDPLVTVDKIGWLGGNIRGWRVLCLAAGGGRQGALYAMAGGDVTVVDISGEMLELDRRTAEQYSLSIRTIQANMQSLPMLSDAEFDLVVHPVSTCYVPDIGPVFREVARVLKGGGLYISQHKQPTSLQATLAPGADGAYQIQHAYYRDTPVPPAEASTRAAQRLRENRAIEYLHRWEQLVGGLCRSGFVVEDLVEPLHAKKDAAASEFGHRARFIAPYVRIKARRSVGSQGNRKSSLLLP